MNRKLIIFLVAFGTLGIVVWGGWSFFVLMSGMEPVPIRTEKLENLSKQRTVDLQAPSSQEHIHALFLEISGHINDGGILKIMYNDSTTYREIVLDSGDVEFTYDGGDWYATNCLLKFIPISDTTRTPKGWL